MGGASVADLNVPLWIMAGVAVLEALVLIGAAGGGFLAYRRVMRLVTELEVRQVAPLREKVDGILTDVRAITARVSHDTERVDQAIHTTIDRVDETAERVKHRVRHRVADAAGVVRGVRAVIMTLLSSDSRQKPQAAAHGQL